VRHGAITVIAGCWIAWIAIWLVMAFSTKRTVERSARYWPSVSVAAIFVIWIRLRAGSDASLHGAVWASSTAVDLVSVALVVGGLVFTVWARLTLGRNWSGSVTFKEDHELIERGPYALVRHPIYTGLLAMMLGTALAYAEPLGFLLFCAGVVALSLKARTEERLMTSHFPDEYPAYRRRVKALIPHVL
jgi:protein-S-isoprenylcysteine O-methyltransferase Ste14